MGSMLPTSAKAEVPSAETPWTRLDTLLLVGVLLLAASFDFYHLGRESLWLDEATTFRRSVLPINRLVADSISHFHIPTYFVLMHYVMKLGDTELWLRLPSAIGGTLAVGACFFYGRLVKDRFTGGVAALLMALSTFQLTYAQEARMYALLVFATTLSSIGLVWLVKHPALAAAPFVRRGARGFELTPAWRYWLLCVLGLLAALYLHNMAAMSAVALTLVVLGTIATEPKHRFGLLRNWCLAGAFVMAAYARWIVVVMSQLSRSKGQSWGRHAARDELGAIAYMFGLSSTWTVVLPLLGGALAVFAVVKSVRAGKRRLTLTLTVLGLALLPIGAALAAGSVQQVFSPRTLIGATTSGHVLIALGISYLPLPLAAAATLALAGLNMPSVLRYYGDLHKEGWNEALPFIHRSWRPKSLVLFSKRESVQYNYYTDRKDRPFPPYPSGVLEPKEIAEKTKGLRYVFVIVTDYRPGGTEPTIRTLEDQRWERVRVFEASRLQVIQYRRPKRR